MKNLFVKEHAEKLTKAQNKVGHEGNVEEARKVQEKQKAEESTQSITRKKPTENENGVLPHYGSRQRSR